MRTPPTPRIPDIGETIKPESSACPECGRQVFDEQSPGPCIAVSICGCWLVRPMLDALPGGCDAARRRYRLARGEPTQSIWRTGKRVKLNVYCDDQPMFMARTAEDAARMVELLNLGEAASAGRT